MLPLKFAIAAVAVVLAVGLTLFPHESAAHMCGRDHAGAHSDLRANEPSSLCWSDATFADIDDEIELQFLGKQKEANPAERQALKEEYTAWLNTFIPACNPPEDTPTKIAEWRELPCVMNALYEKLVELGGVLADLPAIGQPLDFIHPFCLDFLVPLAGDYYTDPYPLDLCNRAYSHIPVDQRGSTYSWRGLGGHSAYKIAGWLEDGTAVFILSYGGSTTFSFVVLVKGVPRFTEGEPITGEAVAQFLRTGVSGCILTDVEVVGASSLRLKCVLTPSHVFKRSFLNLHLPDPTLREKLAGDLFLRSNFSSGSPSHIGTYELLVDTDTWRDEFVSARITRADRSARGEIGECFNHALREILEKYQHQLRTPEQITDLLVNFDRLCLDAEE